MILGILLGLKFILFTSLTKVEFYRFTVIAISTLISILIITLIYSSKMKNKDNKAIVFYSLVSIIMLVDTMYFAQFNMLPKLIALKQAGQLTAVMDSIRFLLKPSTLILILDIPLVIYIIKKTELSRFFEIKANKSVSLILLFLIIGLFSRAYYKEGIKSVLAQELFTYHVLDIKDTIINVGGRQTDEEIISQEDIDEFKERARLKEGKYTAIGRGKNLIVIQVEGLQDFVIDLKQDGKEVSPNLNRLIRDPSSLYYDEYFQLLGRGNTSDSEFVTHNSIHPSMDEPTYSQYPDNHFYGLPWLLRDNGYTAWAFHGYEKDFWNRDLAYEGQGFQRFISQEDYEIGEIIGLGITDKDFFHQSIGYMKELDRIDENPFYAFLVTLTSHTPFKMPEKYQVLDIEEPYKDNMIGDYLQSVHYTDEAIGEFIEELKEEGLYENSIIAIYGDHFAISATQAEKDLMGTLLNREYDFDEMMNIPLIIHIPGEEMEGKISKVASMLDFYPTISNIMGYENTKGLVFGRDLNNYQGENQVKPQTYMLKGSFIDKDILFEISRDGVFSHSRAINRKTRQILDVEQFKERSKAIEFEIDKSDLILKNDYLKEMLER
ncbi:MAG TPA: LTA synthase family protein [Tissierellaceae bacterium]|nr:LTA synthase family protein [Tissierellaceae bacterium]